MKQLRFGVTATSYVHGKSQPFKISAKYAVGVFALSSALLGQTMAPSSPTSNASPETVELSPFVVTTGQTGWVANETLSGTRLRTDVKDLPNQLETLTKEFMDDMGVNNLDQALLYTANTQNDTEFIPDSPGNQVQAPDNPARIRGLGEGTLSRNFFPTQSQSDNYNVDRVTVASGPNAILFGLGSPSGILDATPARAQMRNKYGFRMKFDSEDSKRVTFDANAVILPKKLALRLMGLSEKSYTFKKPNFDRDDRLYGTMTFKPFQNTTITVEGERISRSWNKAGRTTPFDFVTPWLYSDQIAGSGYTTAKPIYNNTSFPNIGTNRIFARASANPVLIQGQDSSLMRNWNNSVVVRSPSTLPGVDPTFDAGANYTLVDPSIFPFDVNVLGNTRANVLNGKNKSVFLEQKLADNLFLELAYNSDQSDDRILSAGGNPSGTNIRLMVDANQFIPDTTTPNPHVGEYYYQGSSGSRLQFYNREDWRGTLSYEFDAGKKLGQHSEWMKWLGRHRLLGLYSYSKDEARNQNTFQARILDDPTITGITLRAKTNRNWANDVSRVPQFRHYLGNPYEPTEAFGPLQGNWTLTDANGKPYTLYTYDTGLMNADGTKRLGAQAAPSGIKNKVDAQILVWQGYFLPDKDNRDRLIVTYGYRKDTSRSAIQDAASTTQDFSGLYPTIWDVTYDPYGAKESGTNRNFGVVAHPLPWLSLSYNKSTTFDLNIGRYDPFGNVLPGAGGDGRDYGVRVDLWRNKLSLKVNKYENSLGPTRASQQINNFTTFFATVENRVLELDPGISRINVADGNQHGFPILGSNNYNISSDAYAKGYEVELNFSPTPNWNVRLNGSKGDSTESNIGSDWIDWANQRLPVWQSVVAKNGELDSAGHPVTWNTAPVNASSPTGATLAQYYQNTLVGQGLAFMSAVDGRSNPSAREGRVNLIVNYRFTEGKLKGFSVGGAVRYRSAPVIGYGIKTNSAGATVLDLDKVYKGDVEKYVDFMAAYRGKMKAFGGFSYVVQLNVKNLMNEDDPVPAGALTTGAISRLVTVDPRVISLGFGVDF